MSEITTWYRASDRKVEAIAVQRESEQFVWADEWRNGRFRRSAKVSRWGRYFQTELEALTYVRDQSAKRVGNLEDALQRARSALGESEAQLRAHTGGQQP